MSLHDRLAAIAHAFAIDLLRAIRSAPIGELGAVDSMAGELSPELRGGFGAPKARARGRTPPDLKAMIKHVLEVIALHPQGAAPAALRADLPLDKRAWTTFINAACARGDVRRIGSRRGTRYVRGGGAKSVPSIRRRPPTTSKKPSTDLLQAALRAFLQANPMGVGAGEICTALDLTGGIFDKQMRVARDRGAVRMTGDRGSARYFAEPEGGGGR